MVAFISCVSSLVINLNYLTRKECIFLFINREITMILDSKTMLVAKYIVVNVWIVAIGRLNLCHCDLSLILSVSFRKKIKNSSLSGTQKCSDTTDTHTPKETFISYISGGWEVQCAFKMRTYRFCFFFLLARRWLRYCVLQQGKILWHHMVDGGRQKTKLCPENFCILIHFLLKMGLHDLSGLKAPFVKTVALGINFRAQIHLFILRWFHT